METPVNKVVFIQKIASFTPLSLNGIIQLAYVNNSWADTIENYGAHLVEERARAGRSSNRTSVFKRAFECDMLWLLDALLYDTSLLNSIDVPMLICENSSTPLSTAKLLLDKMVEVGGTALLQRQLTTTNDHGYNCLMHYCNNSSPTPEIMSLISEKIVEVGGLALLRDQLTATDNTGNNCLLHACDHSSSPEFVKLVLKKIDEAGGPGLLTNQLNATDERGWTCLMLACRRSSAEVLTLVFEKIQQAGGTDLIQNQLSETNREGWTCLMLACNYASAGVVKLVLEKIVEAGGKDLLKEHLDGGLALACSRHTPPPEVLKLLSVVLFELHLFEHQYSKLGDHDKETLKKHAYIKDASWVPDPASVAKVTDMLLKCEE